MTVITPDTAAGTGKVSEDHTLLSVDVLPINHPSKTKHTFSSTIGLQPSSRSFFHWSSYTVSHHSCLLHTNSCLYNVVYSCHSCLVIICHYWTEKHNHFTANFSVSHKSCTVYVVFLLFGRPVNSANTWLITVNTLYFVVCYDNSYKHTFRRSSSLFFLSCSRSSCRLRTCSCPASITVIIIIMTFVQCYLWIVQNC